MKIIYLLIISAIFIILISGFPITFEAAASHNICWIKANNDDVFVRVFDRDRSGNTINNGNFYRKKFLGEGPLWEGVLKRGQTKSIKSSYGEVRYDYKAASAYRAYGNNIATCSHGETIRLP